MTRAADQRALRATICGSLKRQRCGPMWRAQCAELLAPDGARPTLVQSMAADAAISVAQRMRRLILAAGFKP